MIRKKAVICFICAFMILVAASQINAQPQAVPRLSERPLDKASYVQLARQWKEYIEKIFTERPETRTFLQILRLYTLNLWYKFYFEK